MEVKLITLTPDDFEQADLINTVREELAKSVGSTAQPRQPDEHTKSALNMNAPGRSPPPSHLWWLAFQRTILFFKHL